MKKTNARVFMVGLLVMLSMCSRVVLAEAKIGFVDTVKLMEAAPQAKSAQSKIESEFAPREKELVALQQSDEFQADAEPIDVVVSCIREGINSKMKLADTVAERSGSSKRAAHRLIEKYAGTDPAMHKWTYTVQDRGAKVFSLLTPDSAVSDLAGKH